MPFTGAVPFALRNLTEVVADRLRAAILSGSLKQGARISDAEIASQLGISRSPVREALRQLERDGLVTSVPNRGSVVRTLTETDLVDLYAIRGSLERLAVRWAIDRISDHQILALRQLCGEMQAMLPLETEEERTAFREKVVSFHSQIVRAAGSPQLEEMLEGIRLRIELVMATVNRHARVSDVIPEHQELVEALERRDPEAAETAIDRIMQGAITRGLALLSRRDVVGDAVGAKAPAER